MCRFFVLCCETPQSATRWLVDSPRALVHQARLCTQGHCHGDGWGVAAYGDRIEPGVERGVAAAFDDPGYAAAVRRMRGRIVLGHVRRASVGATDHRNLHPFTFGRWAFMHNGTAEGFERVQPRLHEETLPELRHLVQGTTDSEAIFYWLLSHVQRAGCDLATGCQDAAAMAELIGGQCARLDGWCVAPPDKETRLNFVLTDGQSLVATRWRRSLGTRWQMGAASNPSARLWLLASEPADDEAWDEVPDYHVLWIDRRHEPACAAID